MHDRNIKESEVYLKTLLIIPLIDVEHCTLMKETLLSVSFINPRSHEPNAPIPSFSHPETTL